MSKTLIPFDCVPRVEEAHKADEAVAEAHRAAADLPPAHKQHMLNLEYAINERWLTRVHLARELLKAGIRTKIAWRIAFELGEA